MPAVAASEPAKFRQKKRNQSRFFQTQPNSSLFGRNPALMPAWIGRTWQWKVIDYFLFFLLKMWLCPPFISLYFTILSIYFERCSAVKVIWARTLAACSQTRCSLWFRLDEELFGSQAFFFFLQYRMWHNAYKKARRSFVWGWQFFSSTIFKWALSSALGIWVNIYKKNNKSLC